MTLYESIQLRRDVAATWTRKNPVLDEGEQAYEVDTGKYKIGNGHTPWNGLGYYLPEAHVRAAIQEAIANATLGGGTGTDTGALAVHINDPTPHPAYDDGPSLLLLYENAKV